MRLMQNEITGQLYLPGLNQHPKKEPDPVVDLAPKTNSKL